jgi:DNA-binding NarL/FixJ family response regulator
MYDSDERIGPALRAGAHGYVLKGAAHGELLQAIRKAHAMGAR